MKKIQKILLLVLLGLLTSGMVGQIKAIETLPERQSEINATGMLYRLKPRPAGNRQEKHTGDEIEYGLRLDKDLVFSEGSRSERRVDELKLLVPEALRDQVLKLEGRHVRVEGTMHCTMHFSPWTAECEVLVKNISQD